MGKGGEGEMNEDKKKLSLDLMEEYFRQNPEKGIFYLLKNILIDLWEIQKILRKKG